MVAEKNATNNILDGRKDRRKDGRKDTRKDRRKDGRKDGRTELKIIYHRPPLRGAGVRGSGGIITLYTHKNRDICLLRYKIKTTYIIHIKT